MQGAKWLLDKLTFCPVDTVFHDQRRSCSRFSFYTPFLVTLCLNRFDLSLAPTGFLPMLREKEGKKNPACTQEKVVRWQLAGQPCFPFLSCLLHLPSPTHPACDWFSHLSTLNGLNITGTSVKERLNLGAAAKANRQAVWLVKGGSREQRKWGTKK